MLSEFLVYLRLGFEHITDPGGADHLLFVAVLTAADVGRLRSLAWLVTAFTLGHSVTLALATLDLVRVDSRLVEIAIPLTIIATCAVNVAAMKAERSDAQGGATTSRPGGARLRYSLAAGFGLIHGLGFSVFLRAALDPEQGLLLPLFAFNSGLEIGQLALVAGLVTMATALRFARVPQRTWNTGVSALAAVGAGMMIAGRV